ncbi:MAG: chemotaxis response regulator protein-glutamate methylesterase [Clostridia bacterium]|nr:chemotaxis response regulator protein-glutamate methylesterase [Clostridia bacterium]
MADVKVFVVDDSALVRKILTTQLAKYPGIEVIGQAADPYEARDKIVVNKPDVMILDIEMPRMDGLTFLAKLMKSFPIPVIIVSSLSKKGSDVAIRALELGAVDVMAKPSGSYSVVDMVDELVEKIKAASFVSVLSLKKRFEQNQEVITQQTKSNAVFKTTDKIIAIGSSTGGTEAVKDVLVQLPSNMPPIVVTQHMPPNFTKSWAERLNSMCQMEVREAQQGDEIAPGKVLIAPGGYHMTIKRSGARYYVELNQDEPVWHQRPAVDVMFNSVAKYCGKNAVGVIMTGMGRDGASGLKAMRDAGAYTIGQDEKTSIVYGMPKVAFEEGAVCEQQPLNSIAKRLMELV